MKERLRTIWDSMKQRCYNQNHKRYASYGGRGIKVCDEWLNFDNFKQWSLANGYTDTLTLDRRNNDKGYQPDNCRWTTCHVQSCNTRKIHKSNKSGYRGVSWNKSYQKWEVSISIYKTTIKIGYYLDVLQAAKAYDTYVKDNSLEHTINGVLEADERVESNTGKLLTTTNTSGYIGVSNPKRISHLKNPYTASISVKKDKVWSGYFPSALVAAYYRDKAIIELSLSNKRNFSDKDLAELEASPEIRQSLTQESTL